MAGPKPSPDLKASSSTFKPKPLLLDQTKGTGGPQRIARSVGEHLHETKVSSSNFPFPLPLGPKNLSNKAQVIR